MVRPGTLAALVVLGLLFLAASWVDAGMAASPAVSPDPHPSAQGSKAPAPDTYQPPAPSQPEPVTDTVTQQVTGVETPVQTTTPSTPSTGSTSRRQERPATHSKPAVHTQRKPEKAPAKKTAAPNNTRREVVRLAARAENDGRPLLLGGIAMAVLALASGSLLFLVTRVGDAGEGRWEAKS